MKRSAHNGQDGHSVAAPLQLRHRSLHAQQPDGTAGARVGVVEYFRLGDWQAVESRLARAKIRKLSDQAFNIGGGSERAISLLEMLDMIRELHGEPRIELSDWRHAALELARHRRRERPRARPEADRRRDEGSGRGGG